MNKAEFFKLLDGAKEQFSRKNYVPKGIRIDYKNDPFNPYWSMWIVGPGSIDPNLVLASDIWPIKGKYKSAKRVHVDLVKYNRWFEEWEFSQFEASPEVSWVTS